MSLRATDGFSAIRAEFNSLRAQFDALAGGLALPDQIVYVDSADKLPAPIGPIHYLEDGVTYHIAGSVDLAGNRIICSAGGNTIQGFSSSISELKSTGLSGAPLITATGTSFQLRNLQIADLASGAPALFIDAGVSPSGTLLEIYDMNFHSVAEIGTIDSIENVLVRDSVFESSGLIFDGSIKRADFTNCAFSPPASGTSVSLPATSVFTSRLKFLYCLFDIGATETGISVNAAATVPSESLILDSCAFSGAGTYLSGVASSDSKTLFFNCNGISNSAYLGHLYWTGNATATTIAAPSTPTKASGTSSAGPRNERFTHSTGRLTNGGAKTLTFFVTAMASLESGNNHQVALYIAKGGSVLAESKTAVITSATGKSENVTSQTAVRLSPGEYIEVFVENNTSATNITVTELSLAATAN